MLTSLRDRGPSKGWVLGLQGTLQRQGVLACKAWGQEVQPPSLDTGHTQRVNRPLQVSWPELPHPGVVSGLVCARVVLPLPLLPGGKALIGTPRELSACQESPSPAGSLGSLCPRTSSQGGGQEPRVFEVHRKGPW